jgi:Bacterial PH domain
MTEIAFDRQEQVDQIRSGLMPNEVPVAVYDCTGAGTGFVGVTNMRIILQDKSFVGKKVAITSILFDRVTSVSMVSNKSWAGSFFSSGSIAINVGAQTYTADFRGTEKAQHVHNLILHYMRTVPS